jgi:hypothetical protein
MELKLAVGTRVYALNCCVGSHRETLDALAHSQSPRRFAREAARGAQRHTYHSGRCDGT